MPRILGKQTVGGSSNNLTTSQANSYTMPEDGVLNSLTYYVAYDNSPTSRPGDEDIRAAVYTGGTSDTNPNGAVLLEDLGVFELDGTYGGSFITFNTSGRYEIAAGTRVWIAIKSDATFGLGFRFDTGVTGDSVSGFVSDSDDEVAWESTISSAGTQGTRNITMYITYTAKGETKITKTPPPSAPIFVSASSGQELTLLSDDITIDIGTGTNRKAFVFLTNQKGSPTFNHTCSYDPTGKNIQITKLDDLDGNTFSQFDSYYYTSLFYYDIPDGDSGIQTFRTTVDTALRFITQVVVYENCLPGVPYTSSYESAQTQSAAEPFSYTSASLTLDGLSTVVSFGMFERDTNSVTLSPVGIETERNQQNADTGAIGMDAIVGDFTSSLSSVTTEYTSSFSGSLVSCTAVAIKSPLPRGSSIQSDTQWFYDDFNRADQNITGSSAWDHVSGSGVTVIENNVVLAGPGAGTNSDKDLLTRVSSSVMTFNADQSAEIRFTNLKNGDRGGVAVRLQPDLNHESGSGYFVRSDGQNQTTNRIYRIDSGSTTSIGSVNVTVSTDDVMKLTAIGSTISVYVNGALIDSVTDSTYPTGSTGIYYYYGNLRQTTIDNFYTQNIVSGQRGKPFKIS